MNGDGVKIAELLKSITKKLHSGIANRFIDYGFTIPQLLVIRLLSQNTRMKISDLSDKIHLSNSTMSAIVSGLEKKNVLRKIKCDKDRRITYVELNDDYKKLGEQLHIEMEMYLENIIEKADEGEIKNIITGLENLEKLLENNSFCTRGENQ